MLQNLQRGYIIKCRSDDPSNLLGELEGSLPVLHRQPSWLRSVVFFSKFLRILCCEDGCTALMFAAMSGHGPIVTELMKAPEQVLSTVRSKRVDVVDAPHTW